MNAPHRAPATFTNAEFQRLVRSGGLGDTRVELRRGMIVKMNAQYVPHGTVKRLLAKALEAALAAAGLDWTVDQEISVAFGDGFEPMPDIVVWDRAAVHADLSGPIPASAVKLIVEISDTTLGDDLGEKLEDYASGGLAEYWVADVQGRIVLKNCEPRTQGYGQRQTGRFGETMTSLVYPSLSVDTSTLG
jgi:Uma2 family endonuclease